MHLFMTLTEKPSEEKTKNETKYSDSSPMRWLGGVITACWAKPRCPNFLCE